MKALILVLKTSECLAAYWKRNLLEPLLTFLKSLSLVLKTSRSLAAFWKRNLKDWNLY